MLSINGEAVDAESMGEFYGSCFNPKNIIFSIIDEKETRNGRAGFKVEGVDYTECYWKSKLDKYMGKVCEQFAVIDGEMTENNTVADVLFSGFAECNIKK